MIDQFSDSDYTDIVCSYSKKVICPAVSAPEVSGGMHLLLSAVERDLSRFAVNRGASRVACGPGCGACCCLNVEVLFPEAITIAWFLQRRFIASELTALKERLAQLHIKTRWLDDEERLFVRESCAFLDLQGSCLIHKVRPLRCRAITSTSPQACRDAIALAALDGEPRVEMDLFHKNLIDTVYKGLAKALRDSGYDQGPRRLTSAVLELISEPSRLSARGSLWTH